MRGTPTGDLGAILALAGASSVAWAAQAHPVSGFYIGAGVAPNIMPDDPARASGRRRTGQARKHGVPKAAIAVQGFGETHLPVPTGVREPQNRPVEIIIHRVGKSDGNENA
jgi:hypothetical protein